MERKKRRHEKTRKIRAGTYTQHSTHKHHTHTRTHARTAQMSSVTWVIDPADYDAAVAHAPAACPLFAAGDLRSGRQVRETFTSPWTIYIYI
jgi:hypothetical protein